MNAGGAYEITFTEGFKRDVEALPKEIYAIVDRSFRQLEADPFARNPNAKRMKNKRDLYRMEIGDHVRMLYRIPSKQRRVEIVGIAAHQHVYAFDEISRDRPLLPSDVDELRAKIAGAERGKAIRERPSREPPLSIDAPEWVTQDELWVLRIQREEWPAIIAAGSIERLQHVAVNATTRALIEDYWTNPEETVVEKLYTLGPGQDVASIAEQPLSHFLIELDPEQRQALKRIKEDGPYLLKGSAGTGKSLVGLYHIRDQVMARVGKQLFDEKEAEYGVITYTNSLVDANQALLQSVTPSDAHSAIRSTTLEKLSYKLASEVLGQAPNPLKTEGIEKWIGELVIPSLAPDVVTVLRRLGSNYIAIEIEQVIQGNGLTSLDEYMTVERRGRKRGLRDAERKAVWTAYEAFSRVCEQRKVQTYEQWRVMALRYLKANPDYPRFGTLFVDEAQDLSRVARQLCLELVRDPKNLLLAADTGQSIYTVPPSWRQTDPRFNFRRRKPILLERSYRATREIGVAIAPLRLDFGDDDDLCKNASPVFSGPKPRWIESQTDRHAEVVGDEIATLLSSAHPVNVGQIAVIVREHEQAERVKHALDARGIGCYFVKKGSSLQINGKQVHILTAHSSKGLGFPIVFVPFVCGDSYPQRKMTEKANDPEQRAQIEENEQRLFYVALSRASYRLFMIADANAPSPFIRKLDRAGHWN